MHWFFTLVFILTQSSGPPVPTLPLEVIVKDEATGNPIPNAQVRWLDAVTHQKNKGNYQDGWSYRPLPSLEAFGHTIHCDENGRASFEAPLGGIYLSVQTEETFAFLVVPSGSQSATLLARPDVNLTLLATDPDGNPVTGVRASISSSKGKRAKWLASATTNELGQAQFTHAHYRIFGAKTVTEESLREEALHLDLSILGGGPVRTPITYSHWQARHVALQTPPLGYIEVLPGDAATKTVNGQLFFIKEVPTSEANTSSSLSSLQNLRVAVRLGLQYQLSVIGGGAVTTLQHEFQGPTRPQELIKVGPITATDHVPITVGSGLSPDDTYAEPRTLTIRLRNAPAVSLWGRARLLQSELQQDGSFTVWVPSAFCKAPYAILDVELWASGTGLGNGIVRGGKPPTERFPIEYPEPKRVRQPDAFGLVLGHIPAKAPESPVVLAGTVTDTQGRPVPLARIQIGADHPLAPYEAWERPKGVGQKGIQCDEQGNFEFRSPEKDLRYRLVPSAPGLGLYTPFFCKSGDTDLSIQIAPAEGDKPFPNYSYRVFTPRKLRPGSLKITLLSADDEPIKREAFVARFFGPPEPDQTQHATRPNSKPKIRRNRFGRNNGWHSIHTNRLGQANIPQHREEPLEGTIEVYSSDLEKPLLYALMELPGAQELALTLTLEEFEPALTGRLVDELGKPIQDERLVLSVGSNDQGIARFPKAPRSSTTTGPDGKFELYAYPTTASLLVSAQGKYPRRTHTVPAGPPTPSPPVSRIQCRFVTVPEFPYGTRNAILVARRLGSLQVDLQLPTGAHSRDLSIELIRVDSSKTIRIYTQGNSATLSRGQLDPGNYRLSISLPAWSSSPPQDSPPGRRSLYRSKPFTVRGGEQTKLPPIDLRGRFRVVAIRATFEGNPISIEPKHFGLRPQERGLNFSWSIDQSVRLFLTQKARVEVALRGHFPFFEETLSLQSRPKRIDLLASEVQIELERSPARTIAIGLGSMALVAPYELAALLIPGVPSATTTWRFPKLHIDRTEQQFIRIQPNGEATLPRRPCFPGEFEPDQLLLALCYRPKGDTYYRDRDFGDLYRRQEARPNLTPSSTSPLYDLSLSPTDPRPEAEQNVRTGDAFWLEILIIPTPSTPLPHQPHLRRFSVKLFGGPALPPCEYYRFYLPPHIHEAIPIQLPTAILKAAHKRMEVR